MVAPAQAEQLRIDSRTNDLSIEGSIGYVISGDRTTLELKADRVRTTVPAAFREAFA